VDNKEINSYMDEMRNGSFILTRNKLLEFVTTKAKERYDAFGNIIGLNKLDKIEKIFKKTHDQIKKNLNEKSDEKKNKINNSSKNLGKFFDMVYDNSENRLYEMLNEILEKKDLPLINSSGNINGILDKIAISVNEISKTNYDDIISLIDSFNIDSELKNKFIDIKKFEERIKENNTVDDNLIQLLQKSLEFMKEKQITKCPVCENKIEMNELTTLLNNKLKELKSYIKIKEDLENAVNDYIAKMNNIKQILSNINEKIKNYPEFDTFFEELNIILKDFDKYLEKMDKFDFDFDFSILFNQIEEKIESLKDFTKNKFKEAEEEKNKKILDELKYIKKELLEYSEIENLSQKIIKLEIQLKLSNIAYESFKKIKKDAINLILEKTRKEINFFYSYIHEGDMISDIDFFQKEHSNGITIKINAMNKKEDPRAFSSEGHLDTLGLCIFLAFIKVFHENCSLIVLDDIVSTVDIPHREKIARLLFENFKDKQFIITTHDKLWYNQIKRMETIYNLHNNFENCEIINWDLETGPELSNYKPSLEKMKEHLQTNDLNCAANEGRRFLEHYLKKSCKANNVKVKMVDKYTVGDMKDPLFKKIRDEVEGTNLSKNYEDIFKKLNMNVPMGNLLSHDNLGSENCSKEEVKNFCDAVIELHKNITCKKCESYLKFEKNKGLFCEERTCNGFVPMIKLK
jgi:DNA repair exonuclease SbcCD ATPase subunit